MSLISLWIYSLACLVTPNWLESMLLPTNSNTMALQFAVNEYSYTMRQLKRHNGLFLPDFATYWRKGAEIHFTFLSELLVSFDGDEVSFVILEKGLPRFKLNDLYNWYE